MTQPQEDAKQPPISSDVPLGTEKEPVPKRMQNGREYLEQEQAKADQQAQEEAKKAKEPIILRHINEAENPELAGKSVSVEAVVSSTSTSYIIPREVSAETKISNEFPDGEESVTFPLDDPRNLTMVAIRDETRDNRIKRSFKGEVFKLETKSYRTVYMVRIRPPVNTLMRKGSELVDDKGFEYKYFDLYIATDKPLSFQPSTLIKITALPLPHPRSQKTTLLAYDIEFPEKVENFDSEKLDRLKAKFHGKTVSERLSWILNNVELYTHIIGRRNIAQAALLTIFTPTYVDLFGEKQRGWGLSDVIGDSTVGKSETVKKIMEFLKAGMYISAETASIVGLVGSVSQIEGDGWFIDWGFLPLMDRKLLAMDGCHTLKPQQWAIVAEAERSGEVAITKAAKGNTYARTRQIKIYNAVDRDAENRFSIKPMSEFLYPILAIAAIEEKNIIARRDIVVFADQRDVTPEQINKRLTVDSEPELEYLSEVLKWAWVESAKVSWTEEALDYLLAKATELVNTFHYERIPVVSPDMKWKLARLSVSMATLTLSTDDYASILVTKDHVSLVCEFLEKEYSAAGLNVLAKTAKLERLTPDDVRHIFENICGKLVKDPIEISKIANILEFILLSGGTTKDQIRVKFELTDNNQFRPLSAALQTEGLINVKRGYYASAKLVEAYKVTNNFNTINRFNTPKTGTPSQKQGQQKIDNSSEEKKEKHYGGSNSDPVKPVKRVKKTCDDCNKLLCRHPNPDKIEDKTIAESCPDFTENRDESGDYGEPGEGMEGF